MIIFDDFEYTKLILNGQAPPCMNRNNIFRSCAKMVAIGEHPYDEVWNALLKYAEANPRFIMTEQTFLDYIEEKKDYRPYKPHEVKFGVNEIRNVNKLPRKLEKKYYLYQLFLFKYYETHKMRVAGREIKRLAGINPNHLSMNELHLGRGITVRREKYTSQVLTKYANNKPYTYYYPIDPAGKTAFTFTYEGDCFMLPNVEFNSNMGELWDKFLEAKKLYL